MSDALIPQWLAELLPSASLAGLGFLTKRNLDKEKESRLRDEKNEEHMQAIELSFERYKTYASENYVRAQTFTSAFIRLEQIMDEIRKSTDTKIGNLSEKLDEKSDQISDDIKALIAKVR